MTGTRIYADLNKSFDGDEGYGVILTCRGTWEDLKKYEVELVEGLAVEFWMDDGDDEGNEDPLFFEGTVHYDATQSHWIALIDESSFRHASEVNQ